MVLFCAYVHVFSPVYFYMLTFSVNFIPINETNTNVLSFGGELIFKPTEDYNGIDSFTFIATDTFGLISDISTVTLNIQPVNDPPLSATKRINLLESTSVFINLRIAAVDTDSPVEILNFTLANIPPQGSFFAYNASDSEGFGEQLDLVVGMDLPNAVMFTPPPLTYGKSFSELSYFLHDELSRSSEASRIIIDVDQINDPPIALLNNHTGLEEGDILITELKGETVLFFIF